MFIEREKMSKKAKKALDARDRMTWGVLSPVTRKSPNKRAYNRKKIKAESGGGYAC